MSTHNEIKELKRRRRIGRIARVALGCVAGAGFIAAALMAPNVLGALGEDKKKEWYVKTVLDDLVARRLMRKVSHGNKVGYELTSNGEEIASKYEIAELGIEKPFRWDGKWRVVMFDIREFRKGAREELRSTLIALGFVRLQKSAWVHPYPCADVIALIKRKYDLGKEVLYLEVDVLENDHWLRDIFFLR